MKTWACALLALVISLAFVPAAQAKFRISLSLSEREPTVGRPVLPGYALPPPVVLRVTVRPR